MQDPAVIMLITSGNYVLMGRQVKKLTPRLDSKEGFVGFASLLYSYLSCGPMSVLSLIKIKIER